MRVWYIDMMFPTPEQTFATNDVRELRRTGVDVAVHSLRGQHSSAKRLLAQWDLEDLHHTHGDSRAIVFGLKMALARPRLSAQLFAWLVGRNWSKPEHLFKSLLLVPRAMDIYHLIERGRPHVVHLFWGHYPALVGYLVQKRLPDIVVSVFLGAYDLEMRYGGSGPVASNADVVWTHSYANVAAIKSLDVPDQRLQVVHRGIELHDIAETAVQHRKIPGRIMSAGRLMKEKGMDDVIRAFAMALSSRPDLTLAIAGGGTQESSLKTLVRDLGISSSVDFLGQISHKDVFAELAKAEILLFMSKKKDERLPNIVKEAMACRCLCIVTDTPGVDELLVNEGSGFIVGQGDVKAAASCITRAFSDREAMRAMTDAAHLHLVDNFDIRRSMAKYIEQWQLLVASRNRRTRRRETPE